MTNDKRRGKKVAVTAEEKRKTAKGRNRKKADLNRKYPKLVNPDVNPFEPVKITTLSDITPELWDKMKECFAMGYSIKETESYLALRPNLIRDLFHKFPLLKEQQEVLSNMPAAMAKKNIAHAIARGDLDTSKWFLERTHSDFKKQADTQVVVGVKVEMKFGDTAVVIDTEGEEVG